MNLELENNFDISNFTSSEEEILTISETKNKEEVLNSPQFLQEEETSTLILIENLDTGTSFWLDKRISYGDFLIVFFLLLIFLLNFLKFILDLEIPKRMNFRK